MSLVSRQAVKTRQRVRIESSFKGQRLVLEAVVVRRSRSRDGHVLGLRFEGLDPRAREQLADVLRNMQVQAALAMQACAFVERLPTLQLPEPEPRTEKSPAMERAPAPMIAAMPIPAPPAAANPTLATPQPYAAPPRSLDAPPVMASPRPRVVAPSERRRVGLEDGWAEDELVTAHYRPSDSAVLPLPSLVRSDEPAASLVDAHELGEADVDVIEAPDAADCTEVSAKTDMTAVTEARVRDWEPGAPVALAELVDTDAAARMIAPSDETLLELELELDEPSPPMLPVFDRTMLTPRPALASFTTTSPVDDASASLGPVRTGKTMVVRVQDLIAAYAPLVEPELDLPEPTSPITAPTTMPRLSEELQAALDRLRRRESAGPATVARDSAEAPAPRPTASARRRRPGVTQVYATSHGEDTQVKALYHAALANQGETKRGDGS